MAAKKQAATRPTLGGHVQALQDALTGLNDWIAHHAAGTGLEGEIANGRDMAARGTRKLAGLTERVDPR
ncbi:hypothetical protein [Candidatus Palauibacter sp.]|uniref:hypothetical protein n=1 Tax=Candidatus Palauibacter sp. TaxID=3101350 RepID=UPI003CC69B5D